MEFKRLTDLTHIIACLAVRITANYLSIARLTVY
jgi:hypothetical protein